jgi:hypothetical protein
MFIVGMLTSRGLVVKDFDRVAEFADRAVTIAGAWWQCASASVHRFLNINN